MEKTKTKILTECGILIALAAVLSLIKVFKLPWGGSITLLSMLPICLISIRQGVKTGLFSSFVYAVIQLVFGILFDGLLGWGLTVGALISCILLDYIIAFTGLGLAGIFADKGMSGVIGGTVLAVFLRFVSHVFSGVFIFASAGKLWEGFETSNTWLYSIVYNGCYMLPELIFTCIGAAVVYKAVFKATNMKL